MGGNVVIIARGGRAGDGPVVDLIQRAGLNVTVTQATREEDIIDAVRDADGIIVPGALSLGVMKSLTRCKVIARAGIGMDAIEGIDVATEKGIVLCNMPGIIEEEVADQTMALLLAVARLTVPMDRYVRDGGWAKGDDLPGPYIPRLFGSTLGLIGFGKIARAVARRAAGFGMQIVAHDPFLSEPTFTTYGVGQGTLGQVLQDSDFVSLHVPLTEETRHLIGCRELRVMRPKAILVNTCRGAVVDEAALVLALREEWIAGAGLDVMEHEPISAQNDLCGLSNVVLTPHCASKSVWADRERHIRAAQEVVAVLAGLRPRAVWNPAVLARLNLR